MRVIVICEFSGVVRRAFAAAGHEVHSCDLLPADDNSDNHLQCDCRNLDYTGVDLAICHPPCTHLAVSGARWFKDKLKEQQEAIEFFLWLTELPVPHIAIENPIGIMSSKHRKPDQIIQPWQFGHGESKATCLWLKNLPKLQPTNILTKTTKYWSNQTPTGQNKLGPSEDRWKLRSITYQGIATAMATQWGKLPESPELLLDF
jgi:site-specific DNA-cytosine methylase